MHILAVIMLHQHKFCVYKGKRKLKYRLLANTLYTFCALFVFILLCKYFFRKCGKKSLQSEFFLERVGSVTVNTTFFSL